MNDFKTTTSFVSEEFTETITLEFCPGHEPSMTIGFGTNDAVESERWVTIDELETILKLAQQFHREQKANARQYGTSDS